MYGCVLVSGQGKNQSGHLKHFIKIKLLQNHSHVLNVHFQLQQKPVTSSTQPPQAETEPEPEANNVPKSDNEEEADQPSEEVSSSAAPSTEPTRKPLLNGRIRPFQSNREFLERLRRRQEQQKQHGYTVSTFLHNFQVW